MEIKEPKTKGDFEKYYELRWRILRKPWNQPKGSEKDGLEKKSTHVMVCDKEKVVGVGRVHFNSKKEAQIRYMAVDEGFRKKGTGKLILDYLENKIKEKGAKFIVLNARESAVDFYKKQGYNIIEKAHTLFGSVPHYKMKKEINSKIQ